MTRPGNDQQIVATALGARANAHAPYSGFRVGAALRDENGNVHAGCNVENAAYPEGSCAETGAIAAMVASGGHRIQSIAIAGGKNAIAFCPPCGGCRQRILEFADQDTLVLVLENENDWQTYTVAELLPVSFRP